MSQPRHGRSPNPFYVLLVVVGAVFAVTACAYAVMMYQSWPLGVPTGQGGLMALLNERGMTILMIELVLLGVSTVAAIGTDEYWRKRSEKTAPPAADQLDRTKPSLARESS